MMMWSRLLLPEPVCPAIKACCKVLFLPASKERNSPPALPIGAERPLIESADHRVAIDSATVLKGNSTLPASFASSPTISRNELKTSTCGSLSKERLCLSKPSSCQTNFLLSSTVTTEESLSNSSILKL